MATFRFDPDSFKKVRGRIDAAQAKKIRLFVFALGAWADDVVGEIGQQLIDVKAFDMGILAAATTRTPVTQTGTRISVVIFNPVEYAVIVEWGRQPGGRPPPLLPLVGWAVRKGIATHLPVNLSPAAFSKELAASAAILRNMEHKAVGGGGGARDHEMDPVVLDLLKVRLIARKIAEKGVAGRHPFSIAWDRKARTFKQDIAALVVQ